MRIAFLGLGRMGAPMARRLIDAGHDLTVWNRTASKAAPFPKRALSPVEAGMGADLAITMLSDPDAVREVVFASGLSKSLRTDAVFVDMSTIGVAAAKRIHESVERATLDAPVGGGVVQAQSGGLTVLAGGAHHTIERARPVLEVFGDVVHCGDAGSGQAMKLAFNAVLAVTMSGIGEAVALGEKLGLETKTVLDVLRRSGAAPMVERKGPMIAKRSYPASFTLSLMRKDASLVREAARDAHAWTPVAALAADLFERSEREGLGDGDYSGITELFRKS